MIIKNNLYQEIQKSIPIPCVDLIILNDKEEILLARRANNPAKGEWWFPGGRIHYLETRLEAVERKLKEECNLEAISIVEVGTYDVFIDKSNNDFKSHSITTVFQVNVGANTLYNLDDQNSEADWKLGRAWLKISLPPFIKFVLNIFSVCNHPLKSYH